MRTKASRRKNLDSFASIMKLRQLLDPIFLYRNGRHFIRRLDERRDHFTNNWKLKRLQNRHGGGRCFIIGNGPSLTMIDLEHLRDEVTFASNKIYLAFKMTSWRPTYYVLEDNHMIEQHHEEIRHHLSCPKFVTDQWRHLFRGERRVIWYPRRYLKEHEFPRFSDNACDAIYCGYMVTYISLQLAYFMGFTQVYLIGVDFNYSLTRSDQNSIVHAADHPQDHFAPDYFKLGERRYLPQLDRAESAMLCAKNFFEAHGRSIHNVTRGGKLEVFERISLDQALRS